MIKYLPQISIKKVVNLYSSPKNQYILNFCRICYTLFCYSRPAPLRLGTWLSFPPSSKNENKVKVFHGKQNQLILHREPMNSWRRKKKTYNKWCIFFSAGYSIQGSGQYSNRGPFFFFFFCSQESLEKKRGVHSALSPLHNRRVL